MGREPCPDQSSDRENYQQGKHTEQAPKQPVLRVEDQRARAEAAHVVVAQVEEFPILFQPQDAHPVRRTAGRDIQFRGNLEALNNQRQQARLVGGGEVS